MNLTNIVQKINKLQKIVEELLCKVEGQKETDPTVPFYIKDLTEKQVNDLLEKLETPIGVWNP